MDASAEFIYLDLEAQEAPKRAARVPRLEDGANIDARQLADLLTAHDRLTALPGEDAADTVAIELDAEQMDALLADPWVPRG